MPRASPLPAFIVTSALCASVSTFAKWGCLYLPQCIVGFMTGAWNVANTQKRVSALGVQCPPLRSGLPSRRSPGSLVSRGSTAVGRPPQTRLSSHLPFFMKSQVLSNWRLDLLTFSFLSFPFYSYCYIYNI